MMDVGGAGLGGVDGLLTWYLLSLPGKLRSFEKRKPSKVSGLSKNWGSRALAPAATPMWVPLRRVMLLERVMSVRHLRVMVTVSMIQLRYIDRLKTGNSHRT